MLSRRGEASPFGPSLATSLRAGDLGPRVGRGEGVALRGQETLRARRARNDIASVEPRMTAPNPVMLSRRGEASPVGPSLATSLRAGDLGPRVAPGQGRSIAGSGDSSR